METASAPPASVSVVLPVFMPSADPAGADLLRRALRSALDQTYPGAFEILVVDDGSPVPVRDTMRSAGLPESPAIRWIRRERNDGPVHALNVGLRKARYELIARLDPDGCWPPGRMAAQAGRFRDDPGLSLVASGMAFLDADEPAPEEPGPPRGVWENALRLASERGRCPFPRDGVLALTSVYLLLGGLSYGAEHRHCEDYHLWSSWLRFFEPGAAPARSGGHRRAPGPVPEEPRDERTAARERIRERLAFAVDWRTHPGTMRRLTGLLGVGPLRCGAVCYRLWRYGPAVRMPERAFEVLRSLLPDRDLRPVDDDWQGPVRRIEDLAEGFAGPANGPGTEGGIVVCSSGSLGPVSERHGG